MTPIKKSIIISTVLLSVFALAATHAQAFFGGKFETLKPKEGHLFIPVKKVDDGKAHYFQARASDGIDVQFFVVKSSDGIIRAAVDSCDVCCRSGKGYVQDGDVMVCTNCGRRFATDRINEVKGGCNPAPLKREIKGKNLVISMAQINANSWYCKFK